MSDEITLYEKSGKIRDAIINKEIIINWGGHYLSGVDGKSPPYHTSTFLGNKIGNAICVDLTGDEIEKLYAAWESKTPLTDPITIKSHHIENCLECGKNFSITTDGVNWEASKCSYPNGIGPIIFELNVPSGKMVVANDLRNLFPVLGNHNIHQPQGILLTVQDHAKIGVAHCHVGNTCPGMYKCENQKYPANTQFIIGNSGKGNKHPYFDPEDQTDCVARISTDLWWYSICDADEFVKRTGESLEKSLKDYDAEIVSCVPGVYRFEHVYHLLHKKKYDSDLPSIYTYINRSRDADPIVDYMLEYNNINLTAEQVIADNLARYPRLYAYQYNYSLCKKVILPLDEQFARSADHLMMTIGSGNTYHPNGFWGGAPHMTSDSPTIETVVLDKPYRWYPGSENYCVLSHIAGLSERIEKPFFVNDSFIALAFNICRCILTHGILDYNKEKESHALDTFRFVKKCMAALKNKYPDKIPTNCIDIRETTKPYINCPL